MIGSPLRDAVAAAARDVRDEALVQEHGLAVEVEDPSVIGPGLLLEASVRLHQRA